MIDINLQQPGVPDLEIPVGAWSVFPGTDRSDFTPVSIGGMVEIFSWLNSMVGGRYNNSIYGLYQQTSLGGTIRRGRIWSELWWSCWTSRPNLRWSIGILKVLRVQQQQIGDIAFSLSIAESRLQTLRKNGLTWVHLKVAGGFNHKHLRKTCRVELLNIFLKDYCKSTIVSIHVHCC